MPMPTLREGCAEGSPPRRMGGHACSYASEQHQQDASHFPPKAENAMKRQVQMQLLERQQRAEVAGEDVSSSGAGASEEAVSSRLSKMALSHDRQFEQAASFINPMQQQILGQHIHSEHECVSNVQQQSQHGDVELQGQLVGQSGACVSNQPSTPSLGVFSGVNATSHSLSPMQLQGPLHPASPLLHSPDSAVTAAASALSEQEQPAVCASLPRFPLSAPFAPGCERPPVQLPHALRREADLQSLLLHMTQRDAQQLSAAAAQQQALRRHLRQQQHAGGGMAALGAGDSSPWIHPEANITGGFGRSSIFGDEPTSSNATGGGLHTNSKCGGETVSVRVPSLVQGKYHSLLLLDSPEKLERQQQLKQEGSDEQGTRRLPSRSVSFCGYPTVCYKALCLDDPHAYVLRVVEDFPLSNFDLVKAAVKRWSPCTTSHPGIVPLRQAFATADFAACRADASGIPPSLSRESRSERRKQHGMRGEGGAGVTASRGERSISLGQRFGEGGGTNVNRRRDSNSLSGFESSDSGEDVSNMTNPICSSSSVVFVFDFFPNWYSMEELYFQISPEVWQMQRQPDQQFRQSGQHERSSREWNFGGEERVSFSGGRSSAPPSCAVSEDLLWSFALQILMALSHIHSYGLAYGALFPSKVLVSYRYRVRLNACGICAATLYGHQGTTAGAASAPSSAVATSAERASTAALLPAGFGPTGGAREGERSISGGGGSSALAQQQRADLVLLGCLLLGLACGTRRVYSEGSAEYLQMLCSGDTEFSSELKAFVFRLLRAETVSAHELLLAYGHRALPLLQQQQQLADALEQLLFREAVRNRLMFLLSKICFIADRPGPVCGEERWSALSERYIVGLFRDYLFFQRGSLNEPVLDLAHVFDGLAKCDSGAPESALLMSADGASVLLTPYKDIKRCIEKSFAELVAAASSPFSTATAGVPPSFNSQLDGVGGVVVGVVGRSPGSGSGSSPPASAAASVGGSLLSAPSAFLASDVATADFMGTVSSHASQTSVFTNSAVSASAASAVLPNSAQQQSLPVSFGGATSSVTAPLCAFSSEGLCLPYTDSRLHRGV